MDSDWAFEDDRLQIQMCALFITTLKQLTSIKSIINIPPDPHTLQFHVK